MVGHIFVTIVSCKFHVDFKENNFFQRAIRQFQHDRNIFIAVARNI